MFSSSCIHLVCYDNISTDTVQLCHHHCPMTLNDLTSIRAIWSSPLSSYDSRTPHDSTSIGPIWTFRPPRRHHHRTLALAKYAKIPSTVRSCAFVSFLVTNKHHWSEIWNLFFQPPFFVYYHEEIFLNTQEENNVDLSMFEMLKSITLVVSLFENSRSIIPPCVQTEA